MLRPKYTIKLLAISGALILSCMFLSGADKKKSSAMDWPAVTKECRPWTYWWWMGSAVDEPNLTEHLETYRKAGMGGVLIVPIYGAKGFEDKYIDYLSPKWMDMLRFTISEAERLNMGVDMTTGTGWNFGGPQISKKDANLKVVSKSYKLDAGASLGEKLPKEPLAALMAYSDGGKIIELTDKVDSNGLLDWIAPDGRWELYAVWTELTNRMVKRAAPGGEGYMLNPFSKRALANYLPRFDKAFADYKGRMPRAHYHDSYEYKVDWCNDFFEQFKSRRGYDLREQLPAFFGKGDDDVIGRIKSDYRQTISELLLEDYTVPWVNWCHEKGSLTRSQAHGSPGNILDLYAAADIPETEIFGPSCFEIPGLRFYVNHWSPAPDPLMLKFSSAAAHVADRKLVASETCTWLDEHFKVALSQCKPEIDQLWISGINHVVYVGMAYSPFNEPWPGWLFYASTNFAPSNSFWRDLPELNTYVARCQAFLQTGRPANDILLYFPIHDVWHNKDEMLIKLEVHNIDKWFYGSGFHTAAKTLWAKGYTFDYVSDRLLTDANTLSGKIRMADAEYQTVIVPQCRFMPLPTLEKLISLAQAGATIIAHGQLPGDVPGFGDMEKRRELLRKALAEIKLTDSECPGISQATVGRGRFLIGVNLEEMLGLIGIARESVVDTNGVQFIRRSYADGYHYFVSNLGKEHLDGWVTLGVKAKSAVLFEPLLSTFGRAAVRQTKSGATEIYLQLEPGQSCILRTFTSKKVTGPKWCYLQPAGEPYQIKGAWQVSFIEGGPNLPGGFETNRLASWTELGDAETKRFAGTAKYTITFDRPAGKAEDWVLDLGRVCESARVKVNGQYVGTLFSIPFKIAIGKFLHKGQNTLEVEVTNLSANRIADMDHRKVNWKKFYDINFCNIKGEPFDASSWPLMDSGLFGPVRLIPFMLIEHPAQ